MCPEVLEGPGGTNTSVSTKTGEILRLGLRMISCDNGAVRTFTLSCSGGGSPSPTPLPGYVLHQSHYQPVHDVEHEEADHRYFWEVPGESARGHHLSGSHHRVGPGNHTEAHPCDYPMADPEHDPPDDEVVVQIKRLEQQGVNDGEGHAHHEVH